jgi:3',5'-cyclic AMP phosphodiesterase CpdA
LLQQAIDTINAMAPDAVAVVGDLTAAGYASEFDEAAEWLSQITAPMVVVPGNHDSRNVGYKHFERLFGERFSRFRRPFDPVRAERLRSSGFTIVAIDSSDPDLNEGHIGRERYGWIHDQFDEPEDIKVLVVHHHLVPIPGTGRERNVISDAGDVLAAVTQVDIDLILSGHKHVPFFWGLNGILVCNSGTVATKRLRGLTPPSWNEIRIDATTMKVYTHYGDGRRALSVIRSRTTRALIREAFYMTDDFLLSNHLVEPEELERRR